jgi:spermidine/putrescine transport system ATP-binding protein
MSDIRLVNVCKSFGQEKVLINYNLSVSAGSFFALLGPSGCGKTTILRLLAGFEQVDSGQIFLGNQDITNLPANERSINTVFQNYALFPHLNVFDNVAYSLRIKKLPNELITQKVLKILHTVHLDKQVYKTIDQLSGGQQQRVALARAVINEPDVLLLDEPLAALDLKLRERVLVELIELQQKLKTTFIYITHDQDEALAVADQMAIMNHDGRIEQIGEPGQIYDQPKTAFVAKFVGTTNIIKGACASTYLENIKNVEKSDLLIYLEGVDKNLNLNRDKLILNLSDQELVNRKFSFSLRPEKIVLTKTDEPLIGYDNALQGQVISVIYHGKSTLYRLRVNDGFVLTVFDQNRGQNGFSEASVGDLVYMHWCSTDVILLAD